MKPRDLTIEERQQLSDQLAGLPSKREEILFTYVYRSFLHDSFRDIEKFLTEYLRFLRTT